MKIYKKRLNEIKQEELYSIFKLRSEVFVVEQRILYIDLDNQDLSSTHYYIKDDLGVFAYLRVIDFGVHYDNYTSIGRFCVREDKRQQGIGKMLIMEAIKDLGNKGIKIASQAYLEDMYRSVGFKTISEPFILEGILHIEMVYGE